MLPRPGWAVPLRGDYRNPWLANTSFGRAPRFRELRPMALSLRSAWIGEFWVRVIIGIVYELIYRDFLSDWPGCDVARFPNYLCWRAARTAVVAAMFAKSSFPGLVFVLHHFRAPRYSRSGWPSSDRDPIGFAWSGRNRSILQAAPFISRRAYSDDRIVHCERSSEATLDFRHGSSTRRPSCSSSAWVSPQ